MPSRCCIGDRVARVMLKSLLILAAALFGPLVVRSPVHAQASSATATETSATLGLSWRLPIAGTLSSRQVHRYPIHVESTRYFHFSVSDAGMRVAAALRRTDGSVIAGVSARWNEPAELAGVLSGPGRYELEVKSLEAGDVTGGYAVRLIEWRRVRPGDAERVNMLRLMATAQEQLDSGGREDLERAASSFRQAVALAKRLGDPHPAADASVGLGDSLLAVGDFARALSTFEMASAVAGATQPDAARSLIGISRALLGLGRNQGALDRALEAVKIAKTQSDPRLTSRALNAVGDAQAFLGQTRQAFETYREALALSTGLADARSRAQTLVNLGFALSDLGQMSQAIDRYQEALILFEDVADTRGLALTQTALGHAYSKTGAKQRALDAYWTATTFFESVYDPPTQASMLNGLGYVHYELGEPGSAILYYQQALDLYRTTRYRNGETNTLLWLGRCQQALGALDLAVERFESALALSRATGNRRLEPYALRHLADIHASRGRETVALGLYQQAREVSRASGDPREESYALNAMARLVNRSGRQSETRALLKEALELSRASADRYGESWTLYNLALVTRDTGEADNALAFVEAALDIVETLRTSVGSLDLRASYYASARQLHELNVELLTRLNDRRPGEGFEAAAFEASEQARARSLLDSLAEAGADVGRGVDPGLLDRERAARRAINAAAEKRMALVASGDDPKRAGALTQELVRLTAVRRELEGQIRAHSTSLSSLARPVPLSLFEVQSEIDGESLLLEYFLGDTQSYLWAVTPSSIDSYKLPPRAEIEKLAREVREILTAPPTAAAKSGRGFRDSESAYWTRASALGDVLVGQVAGLLTGRRRLLIVADGILQYIPFGGLPVPASAGSGTGGQFGSLGARYEIAHLPSASAIAALRSRRAARPPTERTIAIIADPVFEGDDPRLPDQDASDTRMPRTRAPSSAKGPSTLARALRDVGGIGGKLAVPRLLATGREAREILKLAPDAATAFGLDANRSFVTNGDLNRYRIVHFATHGVLDDVHPELSGIILSLYDKGGRPVDGFLRLHDVRSLRLSADLVVLSACSTGLGTEIRGEGLVGLAGGFMHAGASRVLASLWKVDDEATGVLMAHFYTALLQEGLAPAAALKKAQLALRAHERWAHPFYWAAFVLQGDWKQ
jgi:CHAT domain-containing protein/tetratricopeptide (TPR) repeat protein